MPVTWLGKLISAFFILFGFAVFALPAGIIGAGLALKLEQVERSRKRRLKKEAAARLIQLAWKCYQANNACFELSSFFRHQPGDLYKGRVYDSIAKAFVATVRFHLAKSGFKELIRPVDLRNVIESFKYGQMDIFSRLKQLNQAIDLIISRVAIAENERILAINQLAQRLQEDLESIKATTTTIEQGKIEGVKCNIDNDKAKSNGNELVSSNDSEILFPLISTANVRNMILDMIRLSPMQHSPSIPLFSPSSETSETTSIGRTHSSIAFQNNNNFGSSHHHLYHQYQNNYQQRYLQNQQQSTLTTSTITRPMSSPGYYYYYPSTTTTTTTTTTTSGISSTFTTSSNVDDIFQHHPIIQTTIEEGKVTSSSRINNDPIDAYNKEEENKLSSSSSSLSQSSSTKSQDHNNNKSNLRKNSSPKRNSN